MDVEMKPCPFCGTDDLEGSPWPSGNGAWICRCGNPDCSAEIIAGTVDEVTTAWNRRTPEQAE